MNKEERAEAIAAAKPGDGSYVRAYYQVPAEIGRRIVFDGTSGVITGFLDQYLLAELDGRPGDPAILHPTWRVEYLGTTKEASDA